MRVPHRRCRSRHLHRAVLKPFFQFPRGQKRLRGMRDIPAFLMAKDLGLNALMDVGPPTGLELLVERIKEHVFPLRLREARELFRLLLETSGLT